MVISENIFPLINVGVVLFLAVCIFLGYKKGIVWQLLKLLGLLASCFLAWILAPGMAEIIYLYPKKFAPFSGTNVGDLVYQKLNYVVWFIVILLLCTIILWIISPMFKAITEIPVLKQVNSLLGAVLGFLQAFAILLVITYVMNTAIISNGKDVVNHTFLNYVDISTKEVMTIIGESFDENTAIQKVISDPLSLTDEDLKYFVEGLKRCKLDVDKIRDFLTNYGIKPEKINELLGNQ